VFNACLYVSRGMDYVVQQVTRSIVVKKKWKKCLVCTHFHLLSQCRPITKYEEMQSLFVFLKMVNHPSIKMTLLAGKLLKVCIMLYWLPLKKNYGFKFSFIFCKWNNYNW
jgi:hypothetical protein